MGLPEDLGDDPSRRALGFQVPVLRVLREEGLLLEAKYQRERRELAERGKAAFAQETTGPNQVWHLDFSEYETTACGMWRIASCRD